MLNRSQAPAIHGIEHIAFVQPQISKLKNGVDLFWRNGIFNDTSKIELHFKAGSCIAQPIIGSLCAGLLISGTANKNARQIQKALDALGAYYDVSISQDEAIVSIYALKDQLLAGLSSRRIHLVDPKVLEDQPFLQWSQIGTLSYRLVCRRCTRFQAKMRDPCFYSMTRIPHVS